MLLRRASVGSRESNPTFPPYRETDCHRLRKPIAHQGVARVLLSDLVTHITVCERNSPCSWEIPSSRRLGNFRSGCASLLSKTGKVIVYFLFASNSTGPSFWIRHTTLALGGDNISIIVKLENSQARTNDHSCIHG